MSEILHTNNNIGVSRTPTEADNVNMLNLKCENNDALLSNQGDTILFSLHNLEVFAESDDRGGHRRDGTLQVETICLQAN